MDFKTKKFLKTSWTNLNIRCGKYKHLQTKSKCKNYSNISVHFTREEYKQFCISQTETINNLKRPSLDRKNPDLNYTLDNIQIIELVDNIKKSRIGNTWLTNSYGIKRGVRILKNGKFSARITFNRKEIYLGVYQTSEEAEISFKNKYYQLYGKNPW